MTWNRPLLLAKAKALAAHISISIVLVAIALALMLLRWFPEPLFTTDGGGTGLKLLLVVDLVLGPLLTFVVFNPQKARRLMVLDLTVIALLQLGAYGAGLWSIHSVRVQAVAYHEGQFQAVTADTFADQTIEPGSWQVLGNRPPYLVNVRDPKDGDEAAGILTECVVVRHCERRQVGRLLRPLGGAGHGDVGERFLGTLKARHHHHQRSNRPSQ